MELQFKNKSYKPNLRHKAAEIIAQKDNINEVAFKIGFTAQELRFLLSGGVPIGFSNETAKKLCDVLNIDSDSVVFRY